MQFDVSFGKDNQLSIFRNTDSFKYFTLLTFLILQLFSWLVSIAEAFLQGHQDMGSVLAMAKDFLELHHQLLNDLQVSLNM